jgi:hypothetical protein
MEPAVLLGLHRSSMPSRKYNMKDEKLVLIALLSERKWIVSSMVTARFPVRVSSGT